MKNIENLLKKYEGLIEKYSEKDDDRFQYICMNVLKFWDKNSNNPYILESHEDHGLFIHRLKNCVKWASLDYLKSKNNVWKHDEFLDSNDNEYEFNPENNIILNNIFKEAIKVLSHEELNIINKFYYLNMYDSEIAKELNLKKSTVIYKRKCALNKLRIYLEKIGVDSK